MLSDAERHDDPVSSLTRMAAETKAELIVTQAALAVVLAELARLSPDPRGMVADTAIKILVMGHAVGAGLGEGAGGARPERMSAAADCIASWAERLVPARGR